MEAIGKALRRALDGLYLGAGILAALLLIVILGLIVLQMVARWTGMVFVGAPDYAGYAMAGSSFLALAYTMNRGGHIRVGLLLNALGRYRRLGEIWCFGIGTWLSAYFAWHAVRMTYASYQWHDVSQGQDATPMWVPQSLMSIGTVIFAIAFADHLIRLIFIGSHNIREETLDAHME